MITNEDNMKLMARYPDKYFDLAIVDPPYGIGFSHFNRTNKNEKGERFKANKYKQSDWDDAIPTNDYFDELFRVSKKQIIWGVNYFDGMSLNGGRIIWNKLGKDIGRRKVAPTFSECEIAYYSHSNNVKMYSYTYIGNVQGNDYQVLWSNTNRIHPTQKPVQLYKWLLKNYANEGDKILDTHLGSGSIAIACHDLGFDLTACELDTDYYNAAIKRLTDHQKQLKLL